MANGSLPARPARRRGLGGRSYMSPSCALGTLVLLVLPAGPAGAGALCDGAKKQEVRVTVLTILATERDAQVDGCVECIAREVRKKYPRLTGFHRGPMTRKPEERKSRIADVQWTRPPQAIT